MKPGDLVKHFRTGQIGILLRSYEVYDGASPHDVLYIRYIVQTPNGVISTYVDRLELLEEADLETCQTR